ncbi:MAG: VWA domain-containing protein [Betaproteobacteria bacterium]|nr:VWA domain-containing protein [Betaproteobacteria bacterium]
MHFIWSQALWALLSLPLLIILYIWILSRRRSYAVQFSSLQIVRGAVSWRTRYRRHIPPVLILMAITVGIIGLARPTATVTLPADYMTLVMAVDVSRSMLAEDVEPNRIKAAQAAVKEFIRELPVDIRVGIVSFAGTAQVVQAVSESRTDLVEAIDRFQLQRGTATGSGLLLALATLMPDAGINLESAIYGESFTRGSSSNSAPLEAKKTVVPFKPVPAGSYSSGAIVLLSDGRRTTGPDPLEAARRVAERGVKVYTVAFGTPNGFIPGYEGYSFYARVDEEALQGIAKITQGEFFRASNGQDLQQIYEHLSAKFRLETKETEVSVLFAGGAAFLMLAALLLSLWWFKRI